MKTRNVTRSLPAELLRKVAVLAAHRETSVSKLLTEALADLVARTEGEAAPHGVIGAAGRLPAGVAECQT